jgi:GDP-4-dehydro-6-deoxy-D-mannose reductase
MRVLVTGADGFVGRHLCQHLRQSNDDVVTANGPEAASGAVDITNPAAVRAAVESAAPDAIIHLAGFSSVAQSHRRPLTAFAINAGGSVNLLTAVRDVAPKARLLLIASGDIYAPVPAGQRASEDWPLRPVSPYAASKIAAEIAGLQFHRTYGTEVVNVRAFNHIGRGQRTDFVVPSFAAQIAAIRRGKAPPVLHVGDLTAVRDFSHVEDVVEAYRLLVLKGESGQTYNVCSGKGRTIRSVLEQMLELAGVDVHVEIDPERLRPNEVPGLVGDPGKVSRLGWNGARPLEDALLDTLSEADEALSQS